VGADSGGLTSMGMGALAGKAMKAMGGSKAAPVAEDPKKMKARMKDKDGRAMVKNKKGMTTAQMNDAAGRAMMKKGGAVMKAKGKKMMGGGKVKAYKKGGAVSSASKRADGIAQQGHTRGRIV